MKTALLSSLFLLFSVHDFHLSLMQVNHNEETHSLEIAVKLFTDDLTVALVERGAPSNLELGTEREPTEANKWIADYIQQNVKLQLNGKEIEATYLGKEAELDATWCYVEVKNVRKVKTLEVQNSLLLELFNDQTNLVNLNIGGQQKSGLLRKGKTKAKFSF